jgi:hypothetical protein
MATDIVFFLKEYGKGSDLHWPGPVKLIAVDPSEWFCGGTDPRCSTAYSNMYSSYANAGGGRALPGFVARYAKGVSDVGRIAFVGHSAAHGFLNPLLDNDADRSMVSAVLMLDTTFGTNKTGYVKMGIDAVRGKRLFATTTANTGGDCSGASYQDVLPPSRCAPPAAVGGWVPVFNRIVEATGARPKRIATLPPMPEPSGGVTQLGDLLYWWRFVDAQGGSELPHWEQGKITVPFLQAVLIPYWEGKLGGGSWAPYAAAGIALAGGAVAWRLLR